MHTSFTIDPATLGVYAYSLTGAPAPDWRITSPTVIFQSKVPTLTAAQLSSPFLELRIRDDFGNGVDAVSTAQSSTGYQAQNQIRGSLPVPPAPTDPTPIGGLSRAAERLRRDDLPGRREVATASGVDGKTRGGLSVPVGSVW